MMVAIIVQKVKKIFLTLTCCSDDDIQVATRFLFFSLTDFFQSPGSNVTHTQYCWECHRPPKVRNHLSLKCLFVWRKRRRKILYEFSQQKPREEHVCFGFFFQVKLPDKKWKKGFYFLKLLYQDYLLLLLNK